MSTIKHIAWDKNEHTTGRFKDGKPITGVTFQNGLNDIEPNGSFVPCDMGIEEYQGNVTTHKVKRGRYGRLGFTDSGSTNKHLCKLLEKDGNGISFKYIDGDSDLPDVSNGKPSFVSNNGITIEHTPTYKGVKIELIVEDSLTAPIEYSFSMKTYGQSYTYVEQDGGIVVKGANGKNITIHAPYAVDANGDIGPVTMILTEVVGNYQTFKKVVDETWLRQAASPVSIDPDVTIVDGVNGVIKDTWLYEYGANINAGGNTVLKVSGNVQNVLMHVDLSAYSDINVTKAEYQGYLQIRDDSKIITCKKLLREWGEGYQVYANALPGDASWTSAQRYTQDWTLGGCRSDGNDRSATIEWQGLVDGTLATYFSLPLSLSSVQADIDNPSQNFGYHWDDTGYLEGAVQWASSEGATGQKPRFYMEWTVGGAEAWKPNSYYGNRKIASATAPQRSRRIY